MEGLVGEALLLNVFRGGEGELPLALEGVPSQHVVRNDNDDSRPWFNIVILVLSLKHPLRE